MQTQAEATSSNQAVKRHSSPKVSVIIPNYNHAPFLAERFDSVFGQTYRDFEVVYLDDASTDDSNAVFRRYETTHDVSGIFNSQNSGSPFKQWNKGISKARGEYIWIAESDDSASPHFLSEMVPILEENPSVGMAYCQSKIVDASSTVISNNLTWTDDLDRARWLTSFTNRGVDEISNYLAIKNTIPNASAVLLRKSAYTEAGGADEAFSYCGDWMMWVKILKNSDIHFSANPLNLYRFAHVGSVRSKTYKSRTSALEALAVLQWIKKELDPGGTVTSIAAKAHCAKWSAMVREAPLEVRNDIRFLYTMSLIAPGPAAIHALGYPTNLIARAYNRASKFYRARSSSRVRD